VFTHLVFLPSKMTLIRLLCLSLLKCHYFFIVILLLSCSSITTSASILHSHYPTTTIAATTTQSRSKSLFVHLRGGSSSSNNNNNNVPGPKIPSTPPSLTTTTTTQPPADEIGPQHNNEVIPRLIPPPIPPPTTTTNQNNNKSVFWPPWPFSLLDRNNNSQHGESSSIVNRGISSTASDFQTGAALFAAYTRQRARVGLQQIQQVGSALSFHLPPASPPILLLAVLPIAKPLPIIEQATATTTTIGIQYTINTIARKLAIASLGLSVLTWIEYEVKRKRRLTPLPLRLLGGGDGSTSNYRRIVLPPFLPEPLPPLEEDDVLNNGEILPGEDDEEEDIDDDDDDDELMEEEEDDDDDFRNNVIALKRKMRRMYKSATTTSKKKSSSFSSTWRRMRRNRRRELADMNRNVIMNELLTLQALTKNNRRNQQRTNDPSNSNPQQPPLGYALVTGASKGIGRAIAVELARWSIPLILVARDVTQLITLAEELEACYGVRCHVLPADLSQPGVVDRIYQTTSMAGLKVDLLVNNAGICAQGELVEASTGRRDDGCDGGVEEGEDELQKMIAINVGAVTALSHRYGRDMKRSRRGRILFVSSVAGAVPGGGPGVATYAATKAYERSLASGLGKEMERYGVGVTCIMPGAVKGTAFSSGNRALEEALCWKVPFYAMEAESIAGRSVRAMLVGDPAEIVPGWHNRAFLKVGVPMVPQRLTTVVVGLAFGVAPKFPWSRMKKDDIERDGRGSNINGDSNSSRTKRSRRMAPRLLTLPKSKEEIIGDDDNDTVISRSPKLLIREENLDDDLELEKEVDGTKEEVNGTKEEPNKDELQQLSEEAGNIDVEEKCVEQEDVLVALKEETTATNSSITTATQSDAGEEKKKKDKK